MKRIISVLLVIFVVINLSLAEGTAFRGVRQADAKVKQANLISTDSSKNVVVRVANRDFVTIPHDQLAAASYCPGCKAGIIGAAVGVGAAVGIGIYLMHRHRTSLTGCVQQTDNGLNLTAKDGNTYELENGPSEVKARKHLLVRGHKIKATSGRAFRVDHVSRDYGACGV